MSTESKPQEIPTTTAPAAQAPVTEPKTEAVPEVHTHTHEEHVHEHTHEHAHEGHSHEGHTHEGHTHEHAHEHAHEGHVHEGKEGDSDDEEAPELSKQGKFTKFWIIDGGKQERKANKGEKKCKKALLKLGMKQVTGITRVTIKKTDEVVFAISNPDVLKSATNDNCYVVFGQMSYEDPSMAKASTEAKQYAKPEEKKLVEEVKKEEEKPLVVEVKKEEAKDEAPESEEGLTPTNIEMVMSHTKCTRNQAIRALRDTKDDMVNAILKLTS